MKNKIFVAVLVVAGALGFYFLKNKKTEAVQGTAVQTGLVENFVRPHSQTYGNPMGRATVVEWLDPECESCRMVHPFVKQLIKEYQDRVQFVIRYMPYHGNSMFAASALEEAKEFGKFDEALTLLFEKQPEWGDHHNPKPELIVTLLASLGIPKDKLDREYLINKHGDKIRMDEADGKSVGVRGTPSFFVNGMMLRQLGEEELRSAIEDAIK